MDQLSHDKLRIKIEGSPRRPGDPITRDIAFEYLFDRLRSFADPEFTLFLNQMPDDFLIEQAKTIDAEEEKAARFYSTNYVRNKLGLLTGFITIDRETMTERVNPMHSDELITTLYKYWQVGLVIFQGQKGLIPSTNIDQMNDFFKTVDNLRLYSNWKLQNEGQNYNSVLWGAVTDYLKNKVNLSDKDIYDKVSMLLMSARANLDLLTQISHLYDNI